MFGYPFKIHLPPWLPQSHLCYDTEEKPEKPTNGEKYGRVRTLKIQYQLVARVEATDANIDKKKKKIELVNNLISSRKFNLVTPEVNKPLYNQEFERTSKLKTFFGSKGDVNIKMKLNQDMFYPRETLRLNVTIDNSKCKKACEKFIARLIRRMEIYDLKKKSKLFLCHDFVVME